MWPFATTVFLSSALLFLVEPMVAKMVLPAVGGAAMVWNTCVVFFQALLLAGYWYARVMAARVDRRRLAVHALLLTAPLLVLPLSIRADAPSPGTNPTLWLLVALGGAIGLPFFVLSTTTSLFQHWFSDVRGEGDADPYRLYAWSNAASLLALLAYPFIIEPRLPLGRQSRWWALGYVAFVITAASSMIMLWRKGASAEKRAVPLFQAPFPSEPPPTWSRRGRWVVLAFVPSSLMLGVTSYIATDVASVPLLWVVPLAVYLITFVLAFGPQGPFWRQLATHALPVLVLPLALLMITRLPTAFFGAIALHLLVFAAAALVCHAALAHDRPSTAHLTDFYAWIALGGVAGGLFNTLVAPLVFTSIVEYPIAIVAACMLCEREQTLVSSRRARFSVADFALPAAVGVFTAVFFLRVGELVVSPRVLVAGLGVPAIASFTQKRRPLRFALSVGAMLAAGAFVTAVHGRALHTERTFFGVYRVEPDETFAYHELWHGTTLHGTQALADTRRREPLTYYHPTGPLGQAISVLPRLSAESEVGVVGLGAGSVAAYASGDQRWTFYEIDPAVERMARNPAYFSYLSDCGARCAVVIGDARRSLAHARPGQFSLIVLDAFTSDAIPLHLMTREAVALYLGRLQPGGVLAFHISNRHLTLAPVLARLASSQGLVAVDRADRWRPGWPDGKKESEWLLMARDRSDLGPLAADERWIPPAMSSSTPLWTDDFANILSVLR